mgnify:FL=1
MKLAQSLAVGQRFILDVPDLEGVQGIYESIISVLETNRRALDIEALKRAVSWLSDARQILALGMGGGSTICAQEIQYRLFRLGLPVVSQSDGLLVRMMSSAVTPQDVVTCCLWAAIPGKSSRARRLPASTARRLLRLPPPERRWLNRRIWCYRCWYGKRTIS